MRRPRRPSSALGRFVVVAVAAIGGLTVAIPGVSLAAALTHHEARGTRPSQALPAAHAAPGADLFLASQRLDEVLSAAYPRSYGGVAVQEHRAMIDVYMTRMPKGVDRVVDAVAPAGSVDFQRATHSLATLDQIHRELETNWMSLQSEGIDIVGFDTDVATNTEQIQVINPTLDQVETLVRLYGPHTVSIKSVGVAPIPTSFTLRVDQETHGSVPWDALPILVAIEAAIIGLVALVVVRARARRVEPPTGG